MSKPGEEWRVIPFDVRYEASTLGHIRRRDTKEPVETKLHKTHRGSPYLYVNMSFDTQAGSCYWRNLPVHRVIAETFLGEPPCLVATVHHIDGDKYNNAAVNLEYMTPHQHRKHNKEQHKQKQRKKRAEE